ncbi:DNA primase [Bradyrhizobium sp. USDA 4474]
MSRRPAITQAAIIRTLKAFQAAGVGTRKIEIDHVAGKVVVIPGGVVDLEPEKTALDAWRASRGKS